MYKKIKLLKSISIILVLSTVVLSSTIASVSNLTSLSTSKQLKQSTANLISSDIQKFWKTENYSKEVSYSTSWTNFLRGHDNSWTGGYTRDFQIIASDRIVVSNGITLKKENEVLKYSIKDVINAFELSYDPNLGITGRIETKNPNWIVPQNWKWEVKRFVPLLTTKKITDSVFSLEETLISKTTDISSIYKLNVNNQSGVEIPIADSKWFWADQPNPGNNSSGFRKMLFEYGKPANFDFFGRDEISFFGRDEISDEFSIQKEIMFLNKNMETKLIKSFLKFNPNIRLNASNLSNDKILNLKDLQSNKMPELFLLDNNLNSLKELSDIFIISQKYKNWIDDKDKLGWVGVTNITIKDAEQIYQDILNFKFSNLENVKLVVSSIKDGSIPIKLIPGILNSSTSKNLFNKLKNDDLLNEKINSFSDLSLEKYMYIYKSIIGFLASKDIKIDLTRTMLNVDRKIKDVFIWKDGKFANNKETWTSRLEVPSDVEVSQINFKISGLRVSDRKSDEISKSSILIAENKIVKDINFNFWIKYRINGQNWTGGSENNNEAFNVNLENNVEDIIGAKYLYKDSKNNQYNIGLNNKSLGDIIQSKVLKNLIIQELNKVLKTKNSKTDLVEVSNIENNLFGIGVKGRDEAIALVSLEKWKNAWSKFNISLVSENDELNPTNIPVILVNNLDGIFYSYIKINNWILEDGSSNWISDREKVDFIKSLNLGGLKIVEMPLRKEERYNLVTKNWDKNGHFIVKLKII